MPEKMIPVDDQLYSTLSLGTYSFPAEFFYDDLDEYANNLVSWHQQKQIEISLLLEGEAEIQVLERRITLKKGDVFLILPDALHMVKKGNSRTTRYNTIIFDPILLYGYKGSFFYEKYYQTYVSSQPFFHFADTGNIWEKEAVQNLSWLFENFQTASAHRELNIYKKLQNLWLLLCNNLFLSREDLTPSLSHQQRTAALLNYLHAHYKEKFTLAQLAQSAHISSGECGRFFKKMLHMTPWEYLLEYRLSKSIELLAKEDLSITEISEMSGFCTVSYYIKEFRQKTGHTPLNYRKLLRQENRSQ